MYWLDTVIVAVLTIGAVFGAVSGLLWQVARVASLGVAVYASIYLNDWAATLLQDMALQGADPRIAMVLAYLVVFIAIYLTLFSATLLLERGMTVVCLQPVNRLLGGALGMVKAGLILGAIFLGMASYPHANTQELMDRSTLAPALAEGMQLVIVAIPQEYKDWLCSGLQSLRDVARARAAGMVRLDPVGPPRQLLLGEPPACRAGGPPSLSGRGAQATSFWLRVPDGPAPRSSWPRPPPGAMAAPLHVARSASKPAFTPASTTCLTSAPRGHNPCADSFAS